MSSTLFIARRFLFSKSGSKFISFITYVSIMGIALGVAALIIALSVMNGFEKEIREKVAGLVSHIQINSFTSGGLADYKFGMSEIKQNISGITGISPFVQKEAVIRFKDNVEGIILKGIDPVTDISTARNKIIQGEFNLQPVDSTFSRLMIGDKLAQKLGIKPGDKVIVFGLNGIPSPVNQPRIKQFYISATYETGLRDYDDVIIYTDIPSAQKLFDLGQAVTGIEMNISDINEAEDKVIELKNLLEYPYYPKSMFTQYRALFTWVELQKAPIPIVLGLIILVATFNIISTLLMLVLEKTQSIGILKSLGASRGSVLKIFLFDGLLIGIIGVVLGNIIGVGLLLLEKNLKILSLPEFYYIKQIPILIQPEYVAAVSLIALILSFLATFIPAWLASRMDPVKSLRFS